jgi:hypothetical protein
MKLFTILFLMVLMAKGTLANEIDNLQTIEDVQRFLIKKVSKKWKDYTVLSNIPTDSSVYGKGKFFKVDLDQNGLTDLVINGNHFLAITDRGNGRYSTHYIDRGVFILSKYTLTNIIYSNNTPLLVIQDNSREDPRKDTTKRDTLILKFSYFVEYNSAPDNLQVEEINIETTGCYGTCPIFKVSIKPDKSATYHAIKYNNKKGHFKTTLDNESYNRIIETINYIKLPLLEELYAVNWTDDQTVNLEVKFNNGQVKKITDYGRIGTFGLSCLYSQLAALRYTQQWD